MFESKQRAIVVPQHEHARVAGEVAFHWGNGTLSAPPISPWQLAAGVANHDRGYPPLGRIPIGGTTRETWIETQARGVDAYHPDPIVDLISFWLSLEADGSGALPVYSGAPGARTELSVTVAADGMVEVSPWPLNEPHLSGFFVAYQRAGYPTELIAELIPYRLQPKEGLQ